MLSESIKLKENYTEYKKQYNVNDFIKSNVLEEDKTYFFNGCYYHNKSLLVNDIKKMFPHSTLQDKIKENENLYYKNLENAKNGNAFYAIRYKANMLIYVYNKDTKDFDFDNIPIQKWRKKVFDYEKKYGDAIILNFDYEYYYL